MNWEAISAVSDIIGAVAVVISLIYVATQIKQNTMMMKTGAKHSLTEASQAVIYKVIDHPEIFVKMASGDEASSPEQNAQISLLVRAMLRGFESQCYQYEAGLLEEEEWTALSNAIRDMCAMPGVRPRWEEMRHHMSDRLRRVVDGDEPTAQ